MDLDTVFLALRVVVALAAVFGALFFAHRWITKGRGGSAGAGRQIAVVARQGLGAKAGIAIVDAAGRRYLLGVTEHTVTVLDALGEVPATGEATLVSAQPVSVTRFEQELRSVTITTGELPRLVSGPPPLGGPATRTIPLPPAASGALTRRALRQEEQRQAEQRQRAEEDQAEQRPAPAGPLAGSVLSPATWKQTVDALRRTR